MRWNAPRFALNSTSALISPFASSAVLALSLASAALVGPTAQVWVAASGGFGGVANPNWGGANVWLSLDGPTYNQVGQIAGPARQGVLTASLSAYAGSNPDTTDRLAVNMAESGGILATATSADAQFGNTLCIVDSEFGIRFYGCRTWISVVTVEATLQQLANVVILTARQDERLNALKRRVDHIAQAPTPRHP